MFLLCHVTSSDMWICDFVTEHYPIKFGTYRIVVSGHETFLISDVTCRSPLCQV